MGIENWLYHGAPAGTQQAVQNQARNMGWGQIGKNIWNEGGYGFGKNNVGFDPNYKGLGATKNPLTYTYEALKGNKARGNIGGGTMASRQAWEKLMSSPLTKVGGVMGRSLMSSPMMATTLGPTLMAQHLYGPLASEADTVLGLAGETADEELLDEAFQYLGKNPFTPGASFRSMNDPSVYGTREDDLMNQPNFMGENYSMSEPVKEQSKGIEFLKNLLPTKYIDTLNKVIRPGADESYGGVAGLYPEEIARMQIASSSGDPRVDDYGINIVSGVGNYDQYVKDWNEKYGDKFYETDFMKKKKQHYKNVLADVQRREEIKAQERAAALQKQIAGSVSEGRSMQQSYEDHFSNMGYSSPAERAADTPTGTLGRI
jgi:hypothetical protein